MYRMRVPWGSVPVPVCLFLSRTALQWRRTSTQVAEPMDLPDVTVAFRSGKRADVCIAVCESMLPGDDDLTSV